MDVYVRCDRSTDGRINFSVTDSIVVFICAYCKTRRIKLHLIAASEASCASGLNYSTEILQNLPHEFVKFGEVPDSVQLCNLPAAVSNDGHLIHSGLCALLRGVIKIAHLEYPQSHLNQLLVCYSVSDCV